MKGLAVLACAVLFVRCAGGSDSGSTSSVVQDTIGASGLKVAYVELDSLLVKYNFSIDMNEAMVKKSENVRLTLNQKASALSKEQQDFQKKYENNAFLSQERAQQEYNRLAKMEQDLQELSTRLQNELVEESTKNSLQLRDSITSFLRDYNKSRQYNFIFSNTGLDNLLLADEAYNITDEVIKGLNARYSKTK